MLKSTGTTNWPKSKPAASHEDFQPRITGRGSGTAMAFTSLSMNVAQKRKMKRAGLDTSDIDFFETKIAEEDRNRKEDK
jgi:hypothetical protein